MQAGKDSGIRSEFARRFQGAGIMLVRFRSGEGVRRPVPGQDAVLQGLLPLLPLDEVMGQLCVVVSQAVGIELFDRIPDGLMKFFPPLYQEAVIRHILDHRVFENISRLGKQPLLVDNLQRL